MRIFAAATGNGTGASLDSGADSDEALVRRAGRSDRTAAATLVERHTDKIYAVCFRMLGAKHAAEDAAQETFLRLWRHAARWQPRGARFETWLYRVAMNICLDQLRKAKREAPEEAAPERADPGDRPDDAYFAGEKRFAVDAALARLPARQRMAISLCHFQELSNIEAAKIMEVSVEALESLLARGRRALRAELAPLRDNLMGRMSDETTASIN